MRRPSLPNALAGLLLVAACAKDDPPPSSRSWRRSVHTPVKLTARTSEGVSHRVTYGAPLNDAKDTWYVLAGSATPIASMNCGSPRGSAWVARIERPAK